MAAYKPGGENNKTLENRLRQSPKRARLPSKLHFFFYSFQKNRRTSCLFYPCTGATWDSLRAQSFSLSPSLGWISLWCNTQTPSASGRRINLIAQIRNNHPAKNKTIPKTFQVVSDLVLIFFFLPSFLLFPRPSLVIFNVGI